MKEIERVDRIDDRGNIREHLRRREEARTLCGLVIGMSQPACGNAECRRCAQIIALFRHNLADHPGNLLQLHVKKASTAQHAITTIPVLYGHRMPA